MYILNNKNETIQILKKYFQKFNLNELVFYLENINNENIPTFLKKNTIDPDEIELHNLIQEHFMIVFNILNDSLKTYSRSFSSKL